MIANRRLAWTNRSVHIVFEIETWIYIVPKLTLCLRLFEKAVLTTSFIHGIEVPFLEFVVYLINCVQSPTRYRICLVVRPKSAIILLKFTPVVDEMFDIFKYLIDTVYSNCLCHLLCSTFRNSI